MVAERARRLSQQLANPSVEERISEMICERVVDARVPRMVEQVIEASQTSRQSRILESTTRQVLDVPVPEMAEQLVEAPKNASRDRIQHRNVERIVDDPVPEVEEELVDVSKDFSQGSTALCGGHLRFLAFLSLRKSLRYLTFRREEDATGCEHSNATRRRHSRRGGSHRSGKDQPDDQAH